jgi:hypothetical protein
VSQPDAIVPATSKIPTSASRPAAVVGGMPWSWAAGMKCGWISPIVVAPQIIIPAARYQNGPVLAAVPSARSASRAAPDRTGSTSSASVPP